jgi:AcrR family transcriptional regulator
MGVQERRAREKQELRQEILAAARDLFIHEGFENVSMRKIAEKIEYSPTTIYLYFQDKVDLLDCICEETLTRLEDRLVAIRKAHPAPLDKMQRGLRAYIEFGIEHPSDYRVAFMMEFKNMVEAGRNLRCHELGHRVYHAFRSDVAECIETGVFAPRDADTASQAIWGAIHGLVCLLITRSQFPWVDQATLIETLVDTLVEGCKVPAPASTALTS